MVFQSLDAVILLERARVGASIDAENLVGILGAGARMRDDDARRHARDGRDARVILDEPSRRTGVSIGTRARVTRRDDANDGSRTSSLGTAIRREVEAACVREIHDVNEYMRSLVRALWCGVRGRREARRRPRSKTDGSVRRSKTKKIVAVDRIVREVRLFDRESRAFLRFFVHSFVRGRVMDRLCGDFLELVVDVGVLKFFIRRRRRPRRAGVNVDRTYSSMTSAVHDPTSTVLTSSSSSPKAVSVGGAPGLNSNATS